MTEIKVVPLGAGQGNENETHISTWNLKFSFNNE